MRRILSTDREARRPTSADSGFTLIELVVVMVLVGVLGAVVAMFGNPIRAGIDGQRRAELADAADTAYRRMAREIRTAVPNSIRLIDDNTITFIPSKDGGRYAYDGAGDTENSISFDNALDVQFDVIGSMYPGTTINSGDFIVIGNWTADPARLDLPNAYCPPGGICNRAEVSSFSSPTVTLTSPNAFASAGPTISTPGQRFQLVDGTEGAVTFACSGGKLKRYWNYGWGSDYTLGSSAILAGSVGSCKFNYTNFADLSQLWGLIRMEFNMQRADLPDDTPVQLVYQLHVNNTP
ncbi:MAG: prepilin-type N-terminal cleavage/methylation domain-containing protein [Rhodocyclaceae bacterium]|nr:MAG: prepilin-type N-terminal cleavage/methylation domain-containing protein [Rhodocyclaceae bacterium]